jgi:peptide methionine sulfoxide reductase msrA/msrB
MLKWLDILKFCSQGNPTPDKIIKRTDEEWKSILSEEAYYVTRAKGTERPFSSEMCHAYDPGTYACVCCGNLLFDSYEKFDSGTGWPSFTQPIKENAIAYHKDKSYGMVRVETICNVCEAHLGHVFQDGPTPSGLRYCINAVALKKVTLDEDVAVLGGGCFWCTEAIFQDLIGVKSVVSGYSGGHVKNPTYKEVCSELTGHAEVIKVTYDPGLISYRDLISIHLTTHDPTTLNRQGADRGTQYRSVIFYRNEQERKIAEECIQQMSSLYPNPIVTQIEALSVFYPAEAYHQNYFKSNPDAGYCSVVISPKVNKFRSIFKDKLKQ